MASSKLLGARQLTPGPLLVNNLNLHAAKRRFFKTEIQLSPVLYNHTSFNAFNSLCLKRAKTSQFCSFYDLSTKSSTNYLANALRTLSTETSQKSNLGRKLKTIFKTAIKVIFGSVLLIVGAGGLYIAKVAFIEDDIAPVKSDGPRAPVYHTQITKDWLEYILTKYEEKNVEGAKVKVKDFTINMGMKPGDGYNSTIFRVEVDASIERPSHNDAADEHESMEDHSYNLMVKTSGYQLAELMGQYVMGMSSKEKIAYDSIIPELNEFLEENGHNEYKINIPTFVYGKCNIEENVLVMKNLKPEGYQTYPKTKFLDLHHAKIAVENLAKFHAVSCAYDKNYDMQKKFPRIANDEKAKEFLQMMNRPFVEMSISYLKSKVDHLELGNKLEKKKEKLFNQYKEMLYDENSNKVMCLNHGDYWSNNFMIKYTDESSTEIEQLKMIDFQLMHWNSSVIDLHYMLSFSTRRNFRKEHLEEILNHYHSTFCEIMSQISECPSNWTYEDFKKEFDRCKIYGFIRGLMVLNLAFSEFGKEMKKDNFVLDESNTKTEPSSLERKMAYKSIDVINNKKFLDFIHSMFAYPVKKELMSGKNQLLNELIVDIVTDADEYGLLD